MRFYYKPKFEIRIIKKDKKTKKPLMEILKDGGPFWEDLPGAKRYFKFGIGKAETLLDAIPIIEIFNESKGREPNTPDPKIIENPKYCPRCSIRRYNGFMKGTTWVDRPYLEASGYDLINFGILKSMAILEHQKAIEKFVNDFG